MDKTHQAIKDQFELLSPFFDERMKRLFAAGAAKSLGHGGITIAAKITGLSRKTIAQGIKELGDP